MAVANFTARWAWGAVGLKPRLEAPPPSPPTGTEIVARQCLTIWHHAANEPSPRKWASWRSLQPGLQPNGTPRQEDDHVRNVYQPPATPHLYALGVASLLGEQQTPTGGAAQRLIEVGGDGVDEAAVVGLIEGGQAVDQIEQVVERVRAIVQRADFGVERG